MKSSDTPPEKIAETDSGRFAGTPVRQYKITFAGWSHPGNHAGYNAWDYVPGIRPDMTFPSREDAESALKESFLGPDCDGIAALFEVMADEDDSE